MQVMTIGGDRLAGKGEDAPQPRLVRAAHEFEGQMMKELMKPMTAGDALTGVGDGDSDSGAGSEGALNTFASEALAQALSQRGGLGIANTTVKELSHAGHRHADAKVTSNMHGDTVMRTPE